LVLPVTREVVGVFVRFRAPLHQYKYLLLQDGNVFSRHLTLPVKATDSRIPSPHSRIGRDIKTNSNTATSVNPPIVLYIKDC
jgi:hypothetical protein